MKILFTCFFLYVFFFRSLVANLLLFSASCTIFMAKMAPNNITPHLHVSLLCFPLNLHIWTTASAGKSLPDPSSLGVQKVSGTVSKQSPQKGFKFRLKRGRTI